MKVNKCHLPDVEERSDSDDDSESDDDEEW